MWRKVLLTGVMSVISPGSMLQVLVASLTSLAFLVAHSRAWPFADDGKNRLKLGASAVQCSCSVGSRQGCAELMLHSLPSCSHGGRADGCPYADGPALRRASVDV